MKDAHGRQAAPRRWLDDEEEEGSDVGGGGSADLLVAQQSGVNWREHRDTDMLQRSTSSMRPSGL